MLTLMMIHDNDIASKFKETICILFVFRGIIALINRYLVQPWFWGKSWYAL